MAKIFYLDKGKFLIPYLKDTHIENVGGFLGFKFKKEEEIISICAPGSIHHTELLKILKELDSAFSVEPIFIGRAYSGSILKDTVCFMHDKYSEQGFFSQEPPSTPKEYWDSIIKTFDFFVVSVNK